MRFLDPDSAKMHEQRFKYEQFGNAGNPVVNDKEKVYAEKVTSPQGVVYKVATHDNVPFNPTGMYSARKDHIELRMKKVKKETFDFYMLFLKTNNSLYYTKAQRSYLND
tara:strand:- start:2440 stop:2766 length:327 start_codon:yes stop_codon:yes gene_type:complete